MKKTILMMMLLFAAVLSPAAVPANLALGAKATASAEDDKEPGAMRAEKAVDGDWNSRWSSGTKSKTAWLLLDLGVPKEIGEVRIQWEYAAAKEYSILFSEDGREFTEVAVKKNGRPEEIISFPLASRKARFVKLECRKRLTSYGYSIYELELYGKSANLAFGGKLSASSVEQPAYAAEFAADGARSTRWSSARRDNQWLLLELPEEKTVAKIVLDWERAAAKEYAVGLSRDGRNFTEVYAGKNGVSGRRTIEVEPQTAKFIRIDCRRRLTPYGFSLYEVGVFGPQE
ncbi:discoidin domain-containing protein [Victivallis vadensis]|uniref:Discoidin domain-containing protein n=1 Tax=Victivallis vadensis TaxID=172901 RepID=A0A848AWN1_9BACT|nr:discoidin domain-containing protein [Victivallis vadensis]NMD85940.1 discoidin domain-containing protein [Victivallis vadensis]